MKPIVIFHELQQRGAFGNEVRRAAVCMAHGGWFLLYKIQGSLLQTPVDRGDPHADRKRDLFCDL